MADGCTIKIDGTEVIQNLDQMNARVQAGLNVVGQTVGAQMKSYAQANAPWKDRTGNARGGLNYSVTWQGTTLDIAIFHTVDYGIWLEIAHAQRFAILQDARNSQVETFKNMIKAMKL